MKSPASCAARELKKAFRDLHDCVRRVGLTKMMISDTDLSFELKQLEESAHKRLQRHVEIERLHPRMQVFQAALTTCFPGRDMALSLGWMHTSRPDYVLLIAGRRVLDGGKAAIETGLATFLKASVDAGDSQRLRRAIIPRMHQHWVTLACEGRPLMGLMTEKFRSFDLWSDVSEQEALALFEENRSRARNSEFVGPIVATAVAKGPGVTLQGDRAACGYLAAHAPLADRLRPVISDIHKQNVVRRELEVGLQTQLARILGARGVKSIDIALERRPESRDLWSFSKLEIEGGTEAKQGAIRDAASVLSTYLEKVIERLDAQHVADARLEIVAEREGRSPIETVSLTCQIAGAVSEFEMNWRGVVTGSYPKNPFSVALDVALGNFAVAADLSRDGNPGLYVAVYANGSPWTAHAFWAASAQHAAWLELNHSFNSGLVLSAPEITAYPLELRPWDDVTG